MEQDLVSERRRDKSEELVEVLLYLWCLMDILQVAQNIILHLLR